MDSLLPYPSALPTSDEDDYVDFDESPETFLVSLLGKPVSRRILQSDREAALDVTGRVMAAYHEGEVCPGDLLLILALNLIKERVQMDDLPWERSREAAGTLMRRWQLDIDLSRRVDHRLFKRGNGQAYKVSALDLLDD